MDENKTAVVTGASRGIGKSVTQLLAKNKFNIWACSKTYNKEFVEECKNLEKKNNIKIKNKFFDFNNNEEITKISKEIKVETKKIDTIINNAAIIETSLFQLTKLDNIKNIFQTNYFSHLTFLQILLINMQKNKKGSIINIVSTSALDNEEGRLAYSASKAALLSSSTVLSKELSPYNIRVNAIAPGLTETDMMYNNHSQNIIDDIKNKTSLKKLARPEEIAQLVYFLISENSSHITGQCIRIDGGKV